MSRKVSLKKRKDDRDQQGLRDLAVALSDDSKRETIFQILDAYSRLDKRLLFQRRDLLRDPLQQLLKADAARVLILDILNDSPGSVQRMLEKNVKDAKARSTMMKINALYRPFFMGLYFDPDDWTSAIARPRYDPERNRPYFDIEIVKYNGDKFSMQSSVGSAISLINSLLEEINDAKPAFSRVNINVAEEKLLEETKKLLDSLMSKKPAIGQPSQA